MICPLDYRYGRKVVKDIFSEENKIKTMALVEEALAYANFKVNKISERDYENIKKACREINIQRVKEIENEIKHDVMALVKAISEKAGESGKYVHLGATSNDIIDTANAVQLKQFYEVMENDFIELENVFIDKIRRYKDTVMLGRTHGQHALPITFGLKLAVYLAEIHRQHIRFRESKKRVLVGKMMGAVGTGAGFGEKALEIEKMVMEYLNIDYEEGPTQIIGRDRYIEFISVISNLSTTLEKIATEIRNLQRPEIGEVQEYFDVEKQVGSSTMAHKINPITSENICSLARIVRSMIIPTFENNILWHERDLTNSAGERFTLPHSAVLIDDIMNKMSWLISNLIVNENRMKENLEKSKYYIMDEKIILYLVSKGLSRQDAHEIVRRNAVKSIKENISFKDLFLADDDVKKIMDEEELEKIVDPYSYLGVYQKLIDRILKKVEEENKI
ncbi:MAG: adenylosuccinate lyase [Thermoplasmata archaeon]|jgi:adenylosuccinate lyase